MKKIIALLALACCGISDLSAQTVTLTNNSSCIVDYVLVAIDRGGSCRGRTYIVGTNSIMPTQIVQVDANTTPWNGPAPTGPVEWAVISVYSHQPNICHNYNPVQVPCPWDHMIAMGSGQPSCSNLTSSCMQLHQNNNCNICPPLTVVNGSWTPIGGGSATVLFW